MNERKRAGQIWAGLAILLLLLLPAACGSSEPRLSEELPTRLPTYTPEPAASASAATRAGSAAAIETAALQAATSLAALAPEPTLSPAEPTPTTLSIAPTVTTTLPLSTSVALSAPAPITTTAVSTAAQPLAAASAFTSMMPVLPTLHMPSPDWRDQIIYFVMTDRFADGDPSNNDQGFDEYDPNDPRKYSGGDFAGLIEQLDYIQDLGATALWITPPVANQWWNPQVEFGGYHGYWTVDFGAVDAHLGSLEDYQALSRALHGRGMYLIQDVVANHVGDFFSYTDDAGIAQYNPLDPSENYQPNRATVPVTAPSRPHFYQNDPSNPDHLNAAIYHWTPAIEDFDNVEQRLTFQLADLDDLRTTNPAVREALRTAYGHWIRDVGVDAFRIDTIKHVEHDFWHDFMYSDDPAAPGMLAVAQETGRDDFLAFGEAFYASEPFSDRGERVIASYLGNETQPELSSVIHFPLHYTIGRVFAEGAPTAQMGYRLEATAEVFPDPTLLPVFIDNHDVPRFLAAGTTDGLKQALTFLMTVPGIPVIYYGTEQGLTDARAAMFAEGWGSGGEDRFDTASELYEFIQQVSELRRNYALFARGELTVLQTDAAGPGVLAYARDYAGERAIVLFNTADRPVLMSGLDTRLPGGSTLQPLLEDDGRGEVDVPSDGLVSMELAPRALHVWYAAQADAAMTLPPAVPLEFGVTTPLADRVFTDTLTISGTISTGDAPLKLIINGDLAQAIETTSAADGSWSVDAPLVGVAPDLQENRLQIWAPDQAQLSESFSFISDRTATRASVTVYDLIGDTVGPHERYELPTDTTFGQQLDIVETAVRVDGAMLEVALTMAEVTDGWDPANGFDHVLFHVFVDLPEREGGVTELPRLNAATPNDFAWDYLAMVEGWNNRLYSAQGAGAEAYGAPVTPVAEVETDRDAGVVTLRFAGEALGNPATLAGTRVYVTTWDWNGVDGEYRRLTATPQQWTFGGGDGEVDPLILDDTAVIEVPAEGDVVANQPPGIYEPPGGITAEVEVTFEVSVPASTPDDARLYITGPWAGWAPGGTEYELVRDEEGRYTITLPIEESAEFEFRLTRGSFGNAEKLDPDDRTANRRVEVPTAQSSLTVPVTVQSWWDEP